MGKALVIYHDSCADGFGAAFAAWTALVSKADYLPLQYPEVVSPDLVRGREVYILDFSFPYEVLKEIFYHAKRVVWLDHHLTSFQMIGSSASQVKGSSWPIGKAGPHTILLDRNKSGAYLSWEHFHPDKPIPNLIKFIDDRDRWQFKLKGSKEFHAALWSERPWSFPQWEASFLPPDIDSAAILENAIISDGAAILRSQKVDVSTMLSYARGCEILWVKDGEVSTFEGLACDSPILASELGHELALKSGTFGLVWRNDGTKALCSLRSNGNYDVSHIAKLFGGGGHLNAAGMEVDMLTLLSWLKAL